MSQAREQRSDPPGDNSETLELWIDAEGSPVAIGPARGTPTTAWPIAVRSSVCQASLGVSYEFFNR